MRGKILAAMLTTLLAAALAAGLVQAAPTEGAPQMVNVDGSVYYVDGQPAGNCTPVVAELYSSKGEIKQKKETCTGKGFPPLYQYYNQYKIAFAGIPSEDIIAVQALGVSNSSIAQEFTYIDIIGSRPGIVSDIGHVINGIISAILPKKTPEQPVGQANMTNATPPQPQPSKQPSEITGVPDETAGTVFVNVIFIAAAIWLAFLLARRKKKKARTNVNLALFLLLAVALTALLNIANETGVNAFATALGAGNIAAPANQTPLGKVYTIIVEGGFPTTGKAIEGAEGGAQMQQTYNVDVNDAETPGTIYGPNGENIINNTVSNYTFLANTVYDCGNLCDPSNGNCVIVNISLIRISTGILYQSYKMCGMEGFLPADAQNYNKFKKTLTTEDGHYPNEYYVNVTGTNSTFWGKNGTVGDTAVYLDIHLTNLNDTILPQWSANFSSIPSVYSTTNSSKFNITWTDNNVVGTVYFESNFSGVPYNYTMTSFGSNIFNYNNTLPGGTFYWKSWGSDVNGNWNVSDTWYFTISTADNPVSLTINNGTAYPNQDVTITYGTQTVTTGTALGGATLWRNESSVSTTDTQTLGGGAHLYKINATGNTNYTVNATGLSFYVFVNQAVNPLTLTLNGQQNNITITYGATVTTTGSGQGTLAMYRNETTISSGNVATLGAGYYKYNISSAGNANYLANTTGVTYYATVQKGTPVLSLTTAGTVTYGAAAGVSGSATVISQSDLTISLYRNDTGPISTDLTYPYAVSDSTVYGAACYNFTLNMSATENYTAASTSASLTVQQAPMLLQLLLNGSDADHSYRNGTSANFTVITSPSGQAVSLYTNFSDGTNKLWNSSTSPLYNLTNMTDVGVFNFTAYFAGNENYTANSSTHYATVEFLTPTNITLYFNGSTAASPSFAVGSVINITAVINVAGKVITLYNGFTNAEQNGTTSLTSVMTYGTAGSYNITAWFQGDVQYASSSATVTLTITAAPSAPTTTGGGGGGMFTAGPPAAEPSYSVNNLKNSYGKGDTMALGYSIKNPLPSAIDVTASTSVTKDGMVFWKKDGSTHVNPNATYTWINDIGQVVCSTPSGSYNVKVDWSRGGKIEKTDELTYYVSYGCKQVEVLVEADKPIYSPSDTAHIKVTVRNTGNAEISGAHVSEVLSGANISKSSSWTANIKTGANASNMNNVSLADFQSGAYKYQADVIDSGATIGSGSTTFMLVIPIDIVYYALPMAALGVGLALLWRGKKPLYVKKTILLVLRGTKVDFILVNRTKHVFKKVVITDTVPAGVGMKGVKPKPTKKKMVAGTMHLEWDIKRVTPKERKKFHYNLGKRKRFLPPARVIRYERDIEEEERLAKRQIESAGKKAIRAEHGMMGMFKRNKSEPARNAQPPEVRRLIEERKRLKARLAEVEKIKHLTEERDRLKARLAEVERQINAVKRHGIGIFR